MGLELKMNEDVIRTEHLSCHFGAIRAVDDLSLAVPQGIIFGFLGPNGSGKTTTIRLLLGLLEPNQGRACVLGFDTQTQAEQIRNLSGALLEHSGLYERLSAHDNLEFYGRIYRMDLAKLEARIKELLMHFGLWERRHERVGNWSRGMKQKVAIARALLHRPSLIFLDEPTAGLDPVAAAALRDDIAGLVKAGDVTVFLNTHNLPEAEKLCSQWVESGASLTLWLVIPMTLAATIVADTFAGERERHTLETLLASRLSDRAILLGKLSAAVIFEWIVTQLVFLVALVPTNILHGRGEFILYTPAVAGSGMLLSLLIAILVSMIGIMVSLRSSTVKQAQQKLGISVFMIAYVVPMAGVYGLRYVPNQFREKLVEPFLTGDVVLPTLVVSALLSVLILLLYAVTKSRFQRTRLILNE